METERFKYKYSANLPQENSPKLCSVNDKRFIPVLKLPMTEKETKTNIVDIAQVLLKTLTVAQLYSDVPGSYDSDPVSQHAQYLDSETEAANWNSFPHLHLAIEHRK